MALSFWIPQFWRWNSIEANWRHLFTMDGPMPLCRIPT